MEKRGLTGTLTSDRRDLLGASRLLGESGCCCISAGTGPDACDHCGLVRVPLFVYRDCFYVLIVVRYIFLGEVVDCNPWSTYVSVQPCLVCDR